VEPRIALEDADVAATIEANLLSWRQVFERFPDGRSDRAAGCARWMSSVELPLFNGVIGMPEGADLGASVDAVLEPFDAGRIPVLWILPTDDPAVVSILRARGFDTNGNPGMTIDLAELPSFERPPGTSVEEVDDTPDALRDAATIALTTNGLPATAVDPYVEALARMPDRTMLRTFLAIREGKPVATSTLMAAAGVAGLYNVGTVPDARRTGLGRLVSLAALAAGREAGYRVGVLQSSQLGEPVYRAIGFEQRCTFTFVTRVPAA
jgi:GNAT superfamily N-acetyltransferase